MVSKYHFPMKQISFFNKLLILELLPNVQDKPGTSCGARKKNGLKMRGAYQKITGVSRMNLSNGQLRVILNHNLNNVATGL